MPHTVWDEQSLRWFYDFSSFTGFHEKLAELLKPSLAGYNSLCDVGCGAGLVDLNLTGSVGQVICVDQSEAAVAFLRRMCAARGIANLTATAANCEDLAGSWDAVLFSFFDTGHLDRFLPRCRRLIVVVGEEDTHGLLPGTRKRKHSAGQFKALLRERNLACCVQSAVLEAGQPFPDLTEAVRFVRRYSCCCEEVALEFLQSRLIPIRSGGFAFYLPRSKPIAIFTVAGGLS